MQTTDPAYFLLKDGYTSTPKVYRENCYICRDPEEERKNATHD